MNANHKPEKAGEKLEQAAREDEIKTEDAKGSPLKKGAERVTERAVSANEEGPKAE
ncbi:hypothetical protein [Salaquimonas pukyongi]|uniref:hypothetical protein n=1 Tax=Salaquimonas pukyongi TaxID=2712698 RepID=UPI0012EB2767|nr:hypothetical protein [Salaquimonas pukyongi]